MKILYPLILTPSISLADNIGAPSTKSLQGDVSAPLTSTDQLPGDRTTPNLSSDFQEKVIKAKAAYSDLFDLDEEKKAEPQPVPPPDAPKMPPKPRRYSPVVQTPIVPSTPPPQPPVYDTPSGIRVFARNIAFTQIQDTITLPSGSIAMATVLYGAQITPQAKGRKVLVRLDYTWLGPNSSVVEMRECRAWVPLEADMHIERLMGSAYSISCRTPQGTVFELPLRAHMVNLEDEYLGAKGTLVLPGKAKAAALTFLQGGIEAFGKAMSAAQVTQRAVGSGGLSSPVTTENITGDQTKYIAGTVIERSTSKFLDWFIDYYGSLSPQLAIGPGHKIYLALEGSVQVPKIFFGEQLPSHDLAKSIKKISNTNSIWKK